LSGGAAGSGRLARCAAGSWRIELAVVSWQFAVPSVAVGGWQKTAKFDVGLLAAAIVSTILCHSIFGPKNKIRVTILLTTR